MITMTDGRLTLDVVGHIVNFGQVDPGYFRIVLERVGGELNAQRLSS